MLIELFSDPQAWISLAILTVMEIILGIDNIVFITILCSRLPLEQQISARRMGLAVALVSRLALLLTITWVMKLNDALFTFIRPWSGKDLILFGGGLFLIWKATHEIYENVENPEGEESTGDAPRVAQTHPLRSILLQVVVMDVVFSLDSVITAVGMAEHVPVMMAAVILAVIVMMRFAGPVGDFVANNPSIRVLALSFLILIGVMLMIEGTGGHVSKGYVYTAMGFSLGVELLNMRTRSRARAKRVPPA